jgi:hypothetical protein
MASAIIIPYGCSMECGNPSGHSMYAASFNFFVYLDVFHAQENVGKLRSGFWKLFQGFCFFIAIALSFLIGFARFYVGVHSLN